MSGNEWDKYLNGNVSNYNFSYNHVQTSTQMPISITQPINNMPMRSRNKKSIQKIPLPAIKNTRRRINRFKQTSRRNKNRK